MDLSTDIHYLAKKLDAGSDFAVTQYFYNLDAFLYFRDRCHDAGIEKPIYPGIMPIINADNLIRFSDQCGADIPRWLRKAMSDMQSNEDLLRFGQSVVNLRSTAYLTLLCVTIEVYPLHIDRKNELNCRH